MHHWINKLKLFAFPVQCLGCGEWCKPPQLLCEPCRKDLRLNTPACPGCALGISRDGLFCGQCLNSQWAFDRAFCPFVYDALAANLVKRLKFGRHMYAASVMGTLMAAHLMQPREDLPEVLIPVPLHRFRRARRGFNQASEIALTLGRRMGLPVDQRLCRRVRATPQQSHQNARTRKRNMRNAFRLTATPPARVAIVDDVLTTGSTADALARVLRSGGAEHLEVWCFARARLDG